MKFTYTTLSSVIRSAVFFFLFGMTLVAVGQPSNNSPYARYGLGNLNNGVNVRSAGIGGLSVAMREDSIPFLVNFLNPASYTSIDFTAFDIGVYGNVATISSSTASQNVNKANLSYFAFGFPVLKIRVKGEKARIDTILPDDEEGRKFQLENEKRTIWGGVFGLREFSSVNYSATDSKFDTTGAFGTEDQFEYNYKFQGNGGVNQFFIGIGLRPLRNLSIGLNASYLFGRLNRIQRLEFSENYYFNVKTERYTDVGGFYMDYGIQYSQPVKKGRNVLIFGATFAHPMKVRANSTTLSQTYTLTSFGEDIPRDTIINRVIKGGSITMPWEYGLGITYRVGNKWLIGVEQRHDLWSTYRDVDGRNDSLADSWKTTAGLEFKPSIAETNRGFWAYFGKMHYRFGGYYGMSQYKINGLQLPEYGITLGFGFPLRKTRAGASKYVQSMINLSVEWGQRGTTDRSLLLENFWNFKLGFTLNDRWFIKRKYD